MSDVTGNVSRMVKTCLPTLVCLACAGLMVGGKAATKMKGKPLVAHIGKGIGAYTVGMPLAEARLRSGAGLKPEGVSRVGKTGWLAGPLLLIVDDESQKIETISLTLRSSRGVVIDGAVLTPKLSLDEIQAELPACTSSRGSGGRYVTCKNDKGTLSIYSSKKGDEIWIVIPGSA
ncbi:MAG: hypothetical protein AAFV32_05410 [Myxococcota bacterium]